MNIYDARWENAKKCAKKVNKGIEKGYLCVRFDSDGTTEIYHTSLQIEECGVLDCENDGIYFQEGNCKSYIYFRYSDVYEQTVKETSDLFKQFRFYQPVKG